MARKTTKRKGNKWLEHVKRTMSTMKRKGTYKKGLGLSQVIKEAKKTWHRGGGADDKKPEPIDAPDAPMEGGEDEEKEEMPPTTEPPTAGRRRRSARKTKRRGRK
jgi:hypothetical protein